MATWLSINVHPTYHSEVLSVCITCSRGLQMIQHVPNMQQMTQLWLINNQKQGSTVMPSNESRDKHILEWHNICKISSIAGRFLALSFFYTAMIHPLLRIALLLLLVDFFFSISCRDFAFLFEKKCLHNCDSTCPEVILLSSKCCSFN